MNLHIKMEKMSNWLRLFVHIEIPILDENYFGDYVCSLKCAFLNQTEYARS